MELTRQKLKDIIELAQKGTPEEQIMFSIGMEYEEDPDGEDQEE
jgi:hypothetical protein